MKVLVSTYPYTGHFNPTQPVVRELIRRGHEVVWMTGPAYEAKVRQMGARFVAMSDAALIDDDNIHKLEGKITLSKVADYLKRLFLDRIPAQVADYQRVINGDGIGDDDDEQEARAPFAADVLVVDFCTYAARCYMDLTGLPYATLGINPLVTLDPEIPPWGSGEQPPTTRLGRLRNLVRHHLGIIFFISRLSSALNTYRRGLGLPPRSRWRSYADDVRSPELHIQMTTPAFEFPRKNMLPSVHFVGPLLPTWLSGGSSSSRDDGADSGDDKSGKDADEWPAPPWWDEMLAHPRERIVHITQGTISVNTDLLIKPTVEALAERDDLLLIITGKNVDAMFDDYVEDEQPAGHESEAGSTAVATGSAAPPPPKMKRPANVRTAAFVPHLRLLPHVGVMVTNAGYNGVLAALSCGVPLVCAGRSEDKADVSSRVAWSGAGIDLATSKPTAEAVQAAVLRIVEAGLNGSRRNSTRRNSSMAGGLADEASLAKALADADTLHGPGHNYRAAAKRIRDDFARHDGPAEAVDALEALVARSASRQTGRRHTRTPSLGVRDKESLKAKAE